MRIIVIIGFAAGLLAAALPAQATSGAANAARSDPAREQGQANGSATRERQICVRETRTDSRIVRLTCHTAREWRDLEGEVPGGY